MSFSIELRNAPPSGYYLGGHEIVGVVFFSNEKLPIYTRSLTISLKGEVDVSLRDDGKHHHREVVLRKVVIGCGVAWHKRGDENFPVTQLNPGVRHEFPFRFVLPNSMLPSTLFQNSYGGHGRIEYKIEAQIHSIGTLFNPSKSLNVLIGGVFGSLDHAIHQLSPSSAFYQSSVSTFALQSGHINLKVWIPARGFSRQSRNFVVRVEIDNQSEQDANEISVALRSRIHLHACGRENNFQESSTLSRAKIDCKAGSRVFLDLGLLNLNLKFEI